MTGKAVSALYFGGNNNFTFDFPVCGLGLAGEVLQTNLKSTGSPEVRFLFSEDGAGLDNCTLCTISAMLCLPRHNLTVNCTHNGTLQRPNLGRISKSSTVSATNCVANFCRRLGAVLTFKLEYYRQ